MKNKQNTVWLLAALAAPLAHFSGSGWLNAVLAAFIVLPLSLMPKDWSELNKPLAIIQIGWLGAVAGSLLAASSAYWPSDNHWAVPLTILALAAWTGTAAAPRIGAVIALSRQRPCSRSELARAELFAAHRSVCGQPPASAGGVGTGLRMRLSSLYRDYSSLSEDTGLLLF